MTTIEKSIEVEVPVRVAYNQWTQFEEFPKFMEGVREVRQMDDKTLRWSVEIGGKEEQWIAEITEQVPDERIAWRARAGKRNGGVVTFHRIADSRTRLMLQLDYEPEGVVENVGDALGVLSSRIESTVKDFKKFIESRGAETGGWRGTVR